MEKLLFLFSLQGPASQGFKLMGVPRIVASHPLRASSLSDFELSSKLQTTRAFLDNSHLRGAKYGGARLGPSVPRRKQEARTSQGSQGYSLRPCL